MRYFILTLLFSLFLLGGGCALFPGHQKPAQVAQAEDFPPDSYRMKIKTSHQKKVQEVVFQLDRKDAPQTVANFEELVKRHYYNGMSFHRIFAHQLVQTGDPRSRHGESNYSGTGGPGYTLPAEIHLKHTRGALAMARLPNTLNPNKRSNGGQFYICLEDMPQLDGQYTVFGHLLEGEEFLDKMSETPTNSNHFPLNSLKIISIQKL